jgi:uncharacterized membrane protein YhaH (DUF805 family)
MTYLFGIQGRIGRLQWWGGQAINWGILVVAFGLSGASVAGLDREQIRAYVDQNMLSILATMLAVSVLCFWINVATTVKRYHDRDKSGAWFFIAFVPFIGGLWQLIECGFLAGTSYSNNYGPRGGSDGYGDFADAGLDGARLSSIDAAIEALKRERTDGRQQAQAAPIVRTRREPQPLGRSQSAGFGKRGR